MDPLQEHVHAITRRSLLRRGASGLGAMALGAIAGAQPRLGRPGCA